MPDKSFITVTAIVAAPVEKVWAYWTESKHIMQWNNASPDWHTPRATTDLRVGGTFVYRMEAKDGSMGFDFGGTFTAVVPSQKLDYTIGDGRTVAITFEDLGGKTHIVEKFEAESVNPIERQRQGWQSILDNFKAYTEAH